MHKGYRHADFFFPPVRFCQSVWLRSTQMPPSKRKIQAKAAGLKAKGDPTMYEALQIQRAAKALLGAQKLGIKKKQHLVLPVQQQVSEIKVPAEAEGLRLHMSRSSNSGYMYVKKVREGEYRILTTVQVQKLAGSVFSSGTEAAVAIALVLGEPPNSRTRAQREVTSSPSDSVEEERANDSVQGPWDELQQHFTAKLGSYMASGDLLAALYHFVRFDGKRALLQREGLEFSVPLKSKTGATFRGLLLQSFNTKRRQSHE